MTRKPLTRQRIEEAALELVDREGLDGFSMRKLGKSLGVEAMSLYHHFPSQAHLFDAVMDRLLFALPRSVTLPGTLEERARAALRLYRDMARRHARFFPFIAQHRWNTPGGLAYMEDILGLFREAGHGLERAVQMFRLGGYLLSGAALEQSQDLTSAAEPVTMEQQKTLSPLVWAAAPYFAGRPDDAFELGVKLLVDNLRPSKSGGYSGSSGTSGRGTRRASGRSRAPRPR